MSKATTIILTTAQIRDLADLVCAVEEGADSDHETQWVITDCPESGLLNDEGHPVHYEWIAHSLDYPEEGSIGLGREIDAPKGIGISQEWVSQVTKPGAPDVSANGASLLGPGQAIDSAIGGEKV